jgi:cell division inhibitor SepF
MSVLDKLLSAVKINEDFEEDDFLDEDLLDDSEEDYLDNEDIKPRTSFFQKFGKKKDLDDELDAFDEEPVEPVKAKKEKPVKEESPKVSFRSSTSQTKAASQPKAEKTPVSSKITPMRSSRRNNNNQAANMEVCVIQPKSMEETHEIADTLLDNSTVILNLEGIDVELAQRISDFSFGVTYSLGGRLQKVSSYIFVLVPYNVDITGDLHNVLGASAPSIRAGY